MLHAFGLADIVVNKLIPHDGIIDGVLDPLFRCILCPFLKARFRTLQAA
jgi:hypothetical protein